MNSNKPSDNRSILSEDRFNAALASFEFLNGRDFTAVLGYDMRGNPIIGSLSSNILITGEDKQDVENCLKMILSSASSKQGKKPIITLVNELTDLTIERQYQLLSRRADEYLIATTTSPERLDKNIQNDFGSQFILKFSNRNVYSGIIEMSQDCAITRKLQNEAIELHLTYGGHLYYEIPCLFALQSYTSKTK